MRLSIAFAVLLAACNGSSPTHTIDAGTADTVGLDPSRIPITITGSTPDGPFDVHYIGVAYSGGDCPEGYTISLYETNELATPPVLFVTLPAGNVTAPTGTLSAVATVWNHASVQTPVAFEATHVDLPPTDPLKLAGRAVVNASAWQFDFSIDVLVMAAYCI